MTAFTLTPLWFASMTVLGPLVGCLIVGIGTEIQDRRAGGDRFDPKENDR